MSYSDVRLTLGKILREEHWVQGGGWMGAGWSRPFLPGCHEGSRVLTVVNFWNFRCKPTLAC